MTDLPDISPLAKISPSLYAVLITLAFVALAVGGGWFFIGDRREKKIDRKLERLEAHRERFQSELERRVRNLTEEVQSLRSRLIEMSGYLQASRDMQDQLRGTLARREESLRQAYATIERLEMQIATLERRSRSSDYQARDEDFELADAISAALRSIKA